MIPEGPLLWYVNRGTGLVLLALMTAAMLLGVWSTRGVAGSRVPGFAVQSLHRNLGLLSIVLLALHVTTAVLDEFVAIRWWQAVVPAGLRYSPLWLALGIVASDLLVAAALTSLVRHRMPRRAWWLVHLTTYLAWLVALAHGLGIGTDTGAGWARWTYVGAAVLVTLAVVMRVVLRSPRRPEPTVPTRAQVATSWQRVGGAR